MSARFWLRKKATDGTHEGAREDFKALCIWVTLVEEEGFSDIGLGFKEGIDLGGEVV